jgi:hypothetical protein
LRSGIELARAIRPGRRPSVTQTIAYEDFVKGAGAGWDLSNSKNFDIGDFFQSMVDCEQLLVCCEELTWMHSYAKPERPGSHTGPSSPGTKSTFRAARAVGDLPKCDDAAASLIALDPSR